jgi:hypothetical protein
MPHLTNEEMRDKDATVQERGGRTHHLRTFIRAMVAAWALGTVAFVYFYPHLIYNALERAMVQHGVGGDSSSGIPLNTLYAMPDLASPATSKSNLLAGTNHDTLYTVGWLDLSEGPEVLYVPAIADRYYSLQFVDPWGDVFAYVGRRTTGTSAGDYLVSGPGWQEAVPQGLKQISSPTNTVLLIGRVLVDNESDLAAAYGLERQIRLTSPNRRQPGQ